MKKIKNQISNIKIRMKKNKRRMRAIKEQDKLNSEGRNSIKEMYNNNNLKILNIQKVQAILIQLNQLLKAWTLITIF